MWNCFEGVRERLGAVIERYRKEIIMRSSLYSVNITTQLKLNVSAFLSTVFGVSSNISLVMERLMLGAHTVLAKPWELGSSRLRWELALRDPRSAVPTQRYLWTG